jgi:hypothetical protein
LIPSYSPDYFAVSSKVFEHVYGTGSSRQTGPASGRTGAVAIKTAADGPATLLF